MTTPEQPKALDIPGYASMIEALSKEPSILDLATALEAMVDTIESLDTDA